jgi:hypothetical protein
MNQRVSARYQAVTKTDAESKGIARVHLDAIWWGMREDARAARQLGHEKRAS